MGIAAQVAARWRDWPRNSAFSPLSGGSNPITFPGVPLVIKAELFLGGTWVDVTSGPNGIYYETRIKIRRGRANEATRAQPSECTFRLKNPNRVWSPRNPNGPYYGQLGRNIKTRISVDPGSGMVVRHVGFIAEWPQSWTRGQHRWVDIKSSGILRRLNQGKAPLQSAIYRSVQSHAAFNYAFWQMNEPVGAVSAASNILGGTPLTPTGDVAFAGFTDTPAAGNAVSINAGTMSGNVAPTLSGTSQGWVIGWGMRLKSVPIDADIGKPMLRFNTPGGYFTGWEIVPPSNDSFLPTQLEWTDAAGAGGGSIPMDPFYLIGSTDRATLFDDKWHYYQIVTFVSGGQVFVRGFFDGNYNTGSGSGVLVSGVHGHVSSVQINNELRDWTNYNLGLSNISVANIDLTHYVDFDPQFSDGLAFGGYVGESPIDRFARLCAEEGIDYTIAQLQNDRESMGVQGIDTLLNLLRECEAVNEGVIDEDVNGNLRLTSRNMTWNQPPVMTIDYTTGAIKEGFEPTDDDLLVRNDWTVTRKNGGSRQYQKTTGPLNLNDPADDPQGVNKYDDSATLNSFSTVGGDNSLLDYPLVPGTYGPLNTPDEPLLQHASWRVAHGTVDEMRIARLPLHFSSAAGAPLLASWLLMDMGSRYKVINTPADMGSVPSDQIMTGYEETIDRLEWKATLNGSPASIEQINILDQWGYLDCGACYLAEDLDTTETGIDVAISDTCTWVHTDGDFNIILNGEEMTVTAVSVAAGAGSSWTQTLTVIRSVNGIVKAHTLALMSTPQKQVTVTQPIILAL